MNTVFRFLLLYVLALPLPLMAETVPILTFHELEAMVEAPQHPIRIKGFLYTNQQAFQILAAEPDLKTCCVGSASNRNRQILLKDAVFPAETSTSVVEVEGLLRIDPASHPRFRLENARLIEHEAPSLLFLGSACIVLISCAIGAYLTIKKKL
jgi:hypothetical protein